jgi:hypothetical protein
VFDSGTESYRSDIRVGEKYRDDQTGLEGIVVALCFFQHSCERATLEFINPKDGKLEELTFDAPRLTRLSTGKKSVVTKTGGPDRVGMGRQGMPGSRLSQGA